MTHSDDSTMAASEAADSSFKEVGRTKKSKRLKTMLVQKNPIQRTFKYTVRVYFPAPRAKTKFNPITNMRALFAEMIKYDSTITVENATDNSQIQLVTDALPNNEETFKKYFTVTNDMRKTGNKPYIIVGCHLTSERTIRDIKFDSTKTTKLIDWLAKEQIFIESDSLGIKKTATVGYLTKLHPRLTSRTNLKPIMIEELSEIIIDPTLACELDPSQKQLNTDAMSNGDLFIPVLPEFELFKTTISHGRDTARVKTDVIGIKCAVDKARLLKEFFAQLCNPMEMDTRIGVFIPTGAIHMIGPEAYANLLRENNSYIDNVATVPIGDFQHATLDIPYSTEADTDIDTTTLYDDILQQPWCLSVERSTVENKVLVLTTKGQLNQAREWVDLQLPQLYEQHISDKIDVTTLKHMTPRRLNKPFLTTASTTYADKLKLRTSLISNTNPNLNKFNRPAPTRQTKPADITFAEQAKQQKQTTTTQSTAATNTQNATTTTSTTAPFDYQAELQRITNEIENNLKAKFETAIAHLNQTVVNLDKKFEEKLNQHIEKIQATQADKTTQDKHSSDLQLITKQLGYLVDQISQLLGKPLPPMPTNGIGSS